MLSICDVKLTLTSRMCKNNNRARGPLDIYLQRKASFPWIELSKGIVPICLLYHLNKT